MTRSEEYCICQKDEQKQEDPNEELSQNNPEQFPFCFLAPGEEAGKGDIEHVA